MLNKTIVYCAILIGVTLLAFVGLSIFSIDRVAAEPLPPVGDAPPKPGPFEPRETNPLEASPIPGSLLIHTRVFDIHVPVEQILGVIIQELQDPKTGHRAHHTMLYISLNLDDPKLGLQEFFIPNDSQKPEQIIEVLKSVRSEHRPVR